MARPSWVGRQRVFVVMLAVGVVAIGVYQFAPLRTPPAAMQPSASGQHSADAAYPTPLIPMDESGVLPPYVATPIPQADNRTITYPLPPTATIVSPTNPPTPKPSDPYHVRVSAELNPALPRYWTEIVPVVLRGTVVKVLPDRWTTNDGTRPENPFTYEESIYRPVEIRVSEQLKGTISTSSLWIMASGGRVGDDLVEIYPDTQSRFAVGDDAVVFLTLDQAPAITLDGHPLYHVYERYRIESKNIDDVTELRVTNDIHDFTLADLVLEIRSAAR
jgi:hypothetical protein